MLRRRSLAQQLEEQRAAAAAACASRDALASERDALASERDALAADKAQLVPALEAAKWQGRQLERKLNEAMANREEGAEVGGARVARRGGAR